MNNGILAVRKKGHMTLYRWMEEYPYRWINLILILFITIVISYPFLASLTSLHLPSCPLKAKGLPCPSCGLTHALSALSRGNVDAALQYHAGSLWIAGFFVLQLVMRTGALFAEKISHKLSGVIYTDAGLSLFLLLFCFGKAYRLFLKILEVGRTTYTSHKSLYTYLPAPYIR